MSWCPSQIHSWLLPARNSTTPASSWNVKEIVFEPLLSQRAGQLSVRIGNSASAPGPRGSVCWGCLCPVSLRKWNITTERFCGCSTQLWVFGAQERFMQSWRHNSIQGYPGEIVQKLSFDCNGPWNNLKERNGEKKERRKETAVKEKESNFFLTKNIHIYHNVDPSLWEAGEDRSSDIILILKTWKLRFRKVKPLAQISIARKRQSWNASPCLLLSSGKTGSIQHQ